MEGFELLDFWGVFFFEIDILIRMLFFFVVYRVIWDNLVVFFELLLF